MAKFDIIAAAAQAYKTSWAERKYLAQLAAVPFLVKLACITLASSMAGENYLRFSLIMVPAYLVEGWMLSHYVRLLVLNQRWPFRPVGDDARDFELLKVRARGVLGGTIVYTLIGMATGFLTALAAVYILPYMPDEAGNLPEDMPEILPAACVFIMAFLFWAVRLGWLYIPYAINMRGGEYLHRVRGLSTSVSMIGVWVLCLLPFFLLLQVAGGLIAQPVAMTMGQGAGGFVALFLTVLMDTGKALVATAGVTFGLREMFAPRKARL